MAKKDNTETFIKKAKSIHGNKYDYSNVNYVNSRTKVCIICPKHGEFWQVPAKHTSAKHGCPYCGGTHLSNKENFIKKANEVHNFFYDYYKVNYINCDTKVCIICPKHGEFWQTPDGHLQGKGCGECGNDKSKNAQKSTTHEFIERSSHIHNNKYDYSKVEYINSKTKVCIICPKHGEFWQTPNDHLNGCGCPICRRSKLEEEISQFLDSKKINYIEQAGVQEFEWLGRQTLDFYIPQYNVAIECQGKQHFMENCNFGGKGEGLNVICQRDENKRDKCLKNGITLLYYSNLGIDYPYFVFENKEDLLKSMRQK